MSQRLNPFEKEMLIKIYRKNLGISKSEYCKANGITVQSFNRWIEQYEAAGIEGLAAGSKMPSLLPEGVDATEEAYKREILRLTVENELLKKSIALRMNQDGKIQMQHLDPKNTE